MKKSESDKAFIVQRALEERLATLTTDNIALRKEIDRLRGEVSYYAKELSYLGSAIGEEVYIESVEAIYSARDMKHSSHLRLMFSMPTQKFKPGDIIGIKKLR